MINHLIIGLNQNTLPLINSLEGKIVVVDLVQQAQYTTFESEKVQALYQASLLSAQVDHTNFDDSAQFYDHVANQQVELNYMNKKELMETIVDKNIEVIKGRVNILDEHHVEVSYLSETKALETENLIVNTEFSEQNPYQSPFVFTFDELINTNQLFKRIGIIASSLRALEIASMFNRFGSQVSLIVDRRLFSQIDHLQFRDAIKESLTQQNIKLYEKYEVTEITDQEQSALLHLEPQSKLAFEIGEQTKPQQIEVDVVVIENLEDDFNPNKDILFLNPALALFNSDSEGEIVQIDAQDLTYFKSRFDFDGGIEYRVSDNHIVGATFYCQNAIDLKQILEQITHLNLDELSKLEVLNNSLMGVFKESAQIIFRKEEKNGQTTGRLN